MSCGADTEANELIVSLTAGKNFDLPEIDLDDPIYSVPVDGEGGIFDDVTRLTNEDLTTGTIDGSGTFDALMRGFKTHLKDEYDKGRITGAEYTKTYIALVQGAMSNATQYLLGRDGAYWQAVTAQLQARQARVMEITARIQLQTAKVQMISLQYETLDREANYALTKMKLASESINYCVAKYNLDEMLPQQKELLMKQITQTVEETLGITRRNEMTEKQILGQITTNANLLKQGLLLDDEHALQPQKLDMLGKQILGVVGQNLILTKQGLALDDERELQPYKKSLMSEQVEVQRAQTIDTRADGTPITGAMGKQKQLYDQQITSYKRDAEVKAAKPFIDAWITMKTIDEGLAPPTGFTNVNLDEVLTSLRERNDI